MNFTLILICITSLALAILALADEPRNLGSGFEPDGKFKIEVAIPEGSKQAVLEISDRLEPESSWRKMIGTQSEGSAATVTFWLPEQVRPAGHMFARVSVSPDDDLPTVELHDSNLCQIEYATTNGSQRQLDIISFATGKMTEWGDLPRAQSQQMLISWLLEQPEVASASVSAISDSVSFLFKDGTIGMLMNKPRFSNDPPESQTISSALSDPFSPIAPGNAKAFDAGNSTIELPGSNLAITSFSLEEHFPNSGPVINGWLSANQYNTHHYSSPTLAEIMNWSASQEIGVMFWQSHGCGYRKPDGSDAVGLVTRQIATQGQYSAMLKSGELGLAGEEGQPAPFYTINAGFVKNHLRFAKHSLVVVDACFGATADIAQAFIDQGVGSYASYDWLSGNYSGTPCLKIFDRLLGMNQEPPISSPKERPFTFAAVDWWMDVRGYYYDPSPKYPDQNRPNAKLIWKHHPTQPCHLLKPSIMRVLSESAYDNEPYSKYLIEGDFGADPGETKRAVEWGGVAMKVVRWEPDVGITIRVPSSPPVGAIQVKLNDPFPTVSNPVPITQWTVPFKYEITGLGSKKVVMDLNVKFRGDIHGSRGVPEMPVQYLPTAFSNMADCTGTISASGTHQPETGVTVTWSGGSTLTSIDPNTPENDGSLQKVIWNSGAIDMLNSRIFPFGLVADGTYVETTKIVQPDGSINTVHETIGIGLSGLGYPPPEISINPLNAVFRGNTLTWPTSEGSVKISWPSVTPQMAPDENTQH
ncbi:hypothetical protein JIN85_06400 [Luteolibacter pohnpeiensis]|uniref:Glycoside hydrolase family 42 N-terminal domain-containing protein n=1 Tax=Luteolibacter pohnpeiensis TaxID=454153 RepID=A0A934VU08_9BACT|nr:hypothetical protein [Luteolibacter pohnpeiensis]MBK1882037.1 hypothetical protein [Luteolibacter pohnpeiensis]